MDGVDCTKSGGVYEIECLICGGEQNDGVDTLNDDTERVDITIRPMDTNVSSDDSSRVSEICGNVDTSGINDDTAATMCTETNTGVDTIVRPQMENDTTDGVDGEILRRRTIYIGHTGRSHHSRMVEHLSSVGSNRKT